MAACRGGAKKRGIRKDGTRVENQIPVLSQLAGMRERGENYITQIIALQFRPRRKKNVAAGGKRKEKKKANARRLGPA